MFNNYRKIKTAIKGKSYKLWVADTDEKRKLGLKGISGLPFNHGMIFVYDNPVHHNFTMKNVKIPLKIIFLDKNFNVIDLVNARPGQSVVKSSKPYSYVVEIS